MNLLSLAIKSTKNRRFSLILGIFSVAVSIFLLIGVDMVRKESKNSFLNTISQIDLIVGARSGDINLLLYSVFRIGNPTNNVSWDSYEQITKNDKVKFAIPISLGDSHRNYRVVGTNQDFFKYFAYGDNKHLVFSAGKEFSSINHTVIGYKVAKKLGYSINDKIILSHGIVSTKFNEHKKNPFVVVGILKPTFTPIDDSIYISLDGLDAIHSGWQFSKGKKTKSITAFMIGLKSKIYTFKLMRNINDYKKEPLLAIMPGATLASLYHSLGNFEKILLTISSLVLFSALLSLFVILLSTLNIRRKEMLILRCVGAKYYHIILLYMIDALFIVGTGCVLGVIMLYSCFVFLQEFIIEQYGIYIKISLLDFEQISIIFISIIIGIICSLIPSMLAYKRSMQDGLSIKE